MKLTKEKMESNDTDKNFKYTKELKESSNSNIINDNTFCFFNSINDLSLLIYSKGNKSILLYDLNKDQIINEIRNAHKENITNFRHYFDKINKRDLVISISFEDNTIKLWNVYNCECLLELNNINKKGNIHSSCFLNYKNQIYILTSNFIIFGKPELIKVYDFDGNKIKEINDSNNYILFIDTYYDSKLSKTYIITGNDEKNIKSYDYENNNKYYEYKCNFNYRCPSIIIDDCSYNKEGILYLIGSINKVLDNGYIGIWNFHKGELIKIISLDVEEVCGICLWNYENLFIGGKDGIIQLIDIKKGILVNNFKAHKEDITTIKKINHPYYGNILISQAYEEFGKIKLWINKN